MARSGNHAYSDSEAVRAANSDGEAYGDSEGDNELKFYSSTAWWRPCADGWDYAV